MAVAVSLDGTPVDVHAGPRERSALDVLHIACPKSTQSRPMADCVQYYGGPIKGHGQRCALGEQRGRPHSEPSPPRPSRRVRHAKLLSDLPQPQPAFQLEEQPAADDLHFVKPSREHQVWQQRVATPTRRTPAASNPRSARPTGVLAPNASTRPNPPADANSVDTAAAARRRADQPPHS
jgi:hypothetical protein